MNYKESAEGFVLPDFDFDSLDAVIPVSTPSITPYEFDTLNIFESLYSISQQQGNYDEKLLKRYLSLFKAAILENSKKYIPEELFSQYSVSSFLLQIIDPNKTSLEVLYEALCLAVAWTGSQDRDSEAFAIEPFIIFLIEMSVVSLSDPNFKGNRAIGNAAIALQRNLLANSNNVRFLFIKNRGIELFVSLFFEITNNNIKEYIIKSIQNALMVDPKPPIDDLYFQPLDKLLCSFFGINLKSAEYSEIQLTISYVKCDSSYALHFLNTVEFMSASTEFARASTLTQIKILELFETLVLYPNELVTSISEKKIRWNEFMSKIPFALEDKIKKKFIIFVSHLFEAKYVPLLNTCVISSLLKIVKSGTFLIKKRAIDCLHIVIRSNMPNAMDSIVCHNVIEQVVNFLASDSETVLKFAFEMLLFIIQFAIEGRCSRNVRSQLDEADFEPTMEEVCGNQLSEDAGRLSDVLRAKYEELMEACDELDYMEEEGGNEIPQQQQGNQPFNGNNEEEDDDDDIGFGDGFNNYVIKNNLEGMNENNNNDNADENEEEDEWVDADECPIDD